MNEGGTRPGARAKSARASGARADKASTTGAEAAPGAVRDKNGKGMRASARARTRKQPGVSKEHAAIEAVEATAAIAHEDRHSADAMEEALESFDAELGERLAQAVVDEPVAPEHSTIGAEAGSGIVDDFGRAPVTHARLQPLLDWLYTSYFRVKVEGIEHIPSEGPAMLVCNHGGALPWDGVMLATALMREHPAKRSLRWLVEDFAFHAPFIGPLLNRIGAVRACPENAERLLAEGHVLAVFPEGIQGIGKTYAQRYRLQRFGRGGHVKLALRTRVPMIPVGIAGADDTYPLLYKVRAFSKALGLPFIPITPLFPWLGPLGLAPLPSRFHVAVGAPLDGLSELPVESASDTLVVHDLNDRVRRAVQQLLERALAARGPHAFR